MLEELKKLVMNEESSYEDPQILHAALIVAICVDMVDGSDSTPAWHKEQKFLADKICPLIERFERDAAEGYAMMMRLAEWLTASLSRPFQSALQRLELDDPQKIFRAESAMTEVE